MAVEQRPIARRTRSALSLTERELSQLAAGGETGNDLDNFIDYLSANVLRFETNRAPLKPRASLNPTH
jgi:hypothetical protein